MMISVHGAMDMCTEVGTAVVLCVSLFAVNLEILKHCLLHCHFHSISGSSMCQNMSRREVTAGNKCTILCNKRCEGQLSSIHPYTLETVLGKGLFIY
jgi:hypothetical protein